MLEAEDWMDSRGGRRSVRKAACTTHFASPLFRPLPLRSHHSTLPAGTRAGQIASFKSFPLREHLDKELLQKGRASKSPCPVSRLGAPPLLSHLAYSSLKNPLLFLTKILQLWSLACRHNTDSFIFFFQSSTNLTKPEL